MAGGSSRGGPQLVAAEPIGGALERFSVLRAPEGFSKG
jgi:hypothetical protein